MKHYRSNPSTQAHAAALRKNPTEIEAALWRILRMKQLSSIRFRRQQAIGPYIVDFCAPRQKLVIEVDGSQHLEQEIYDSERTAFLESKGYSVLRFWNDEVLRSQDGVVCAILAAIEKMPPPASPISEERNGGDQEP
jgi:very-short-patch-repair endonuclease